MNTTSLALALRTIFLKNVACELSPCRLFLSATDMRTRAITRHACTATPQEAWHIALAALTTVLLSSLS